VYDDETVDNIPDWKNGEVLDTYVKTLSMFETTRSDRSFPGVEMMMGRRGCVSGEALSEDIARLVDIDSVQAYTTIPCPLDEVAIQRGNEELLQTLNRIYSLYLNGMLSGDIGGAYTRSGEDTTFVQRLPEMQEEVISNGESTTSVQRLSEMQEEAVSSSAE
jgi:hypothetical protein